MMCVCSPLVTSYVSLSLCLHVILQYVQVALLWLKFPFDSYIATSFHELHHQSFTSPVFWLCLFQLASIGVFSCCLFDACISNRMFSFRLTILSPKYYNVYHTKIYAVLLINRTIFIQSLLIIIMRCATYTCTCIIIINFWDYKLIIIMC